MNASDPPLRRPRILIAEDDGVSRELICTRLTKWGYDVIVTENGTDALTELCKRDAPALAILDWMMPGLDGIEICRRVRAAEGTVYIILLTARGGRESVLEGMRAGADDYLTKPFEKEALQARILVGMRVVALQAAVTAQAVKIRELEGRLAT